MSEALQQSAELFGSFGEDEAKSNEESLQELKALGEASIGMLPIVGDAMDAKEFMEAAEQGDRVGMALASIGFVPFIGDAVQAGVRMTADMFRKAPQQVRDRSVKVFADKNNKLPNTEADADMDELAQIAATEEKIYAGMLKRPDAPRAESRAGMPVAKKHGDILYHSTEGGGYRLENRPGKLTPEQAAEKAQLESYIEASTKELDSLRTRLQALPDPEVHGYTPEYEELLDAMSQSYLHRSGLQDKLKPLQVIEEGKDVEVFVPNAEKIVKGGHKPGRHHELRQDLFSTSSDPIYSGRHFGEGRHNDGPRDPKAIADNTVMYDTRGVRGNLEEGQTAQVDDLSRRKYYDIEHSVDEGMPTHLDTKNVGYDEDLNPTALRIPKTVNFNSEAETAIPKRGHALSRIGTLLSESPMKKELMEKGIKQAEDVLNKQGKIGSSLVDFRIQSNMAAMGEDVAPTKKQANILYKEIRDNMKEALDLAKFTERGGARGTYDWYLSNVSNSWNIDSLETLADQLGPQKAENIRNLIKAQKRYIGDYDPNQSLQDMQTYRLMQRDQAKSRHNMRKGEETDLVSFMDLTDKMNKGGFIKRR